MQVTLLVIHTIICVFLIGLVLVQQGKGADAGIVFGSGNASSIFGASGSTSFLVKLTTICAVLFFISTLFLGMRENNVSHRLLDVIDAEVVE